MQIGGTTLSDEAPHRERAPSRRYGWRPMPGQDHSRSAQIWLICALDGVSGTASYSKWDISSRLAWRRRTSMSPPGPGPGGTLGPSIPVTGNLCTRCGAFISAALDAGGAARHAEAASHAGVCGWPRSRRWTIQETSSGRICRKSGGEPAAGGLHRLIPTRLRYRRRPGPLSGRSGPAACVRWGSVAWAGLDPWARVTYHR